MPWTPSWVQESDVRAILQMLQTIDRKVTVTQATLTRMEQQMSAVTDALEELEAQAEANTKAEQSAADLIRNLATLIDKNVGDPTAIRELTTKLKTSADSLGAAVVAGTDHESPEEPPPA